MSFQDLCGADDNFLKRLRFSDEATFHVSGKVNKQNVRIWGTEKPHRIVENERDSPKTNVFCAISTSKVYGPYFFPDRTVGYTAQSWIQSFAPPTRVSLLSCFRFVTHSCFMFSSAFSIIHPQCLTHPVVLPASRVVQWRPFPCFASGKMVQHISQVITEYEERLRRSCYVPRFSYGRRMLRDDDSPNRCFLMYLFSEESIAIQFLKDIGLLRSKMLCNTCGRDMTWFVDQCP